MRNINYLKSIFMVGFSAIALMLVVTSCQKGFNPKTYAPTKPPPPPPSYDGFSAANDIEPGSLVGYWPFSGSLTDSISKLPGTATNSSIGAGIEGKGYEGSLTGYAICGTPPGLASLQNFTVSVWVNTTPPTTGVLDYFTLANTKAFWGNIEMFFDNGSTNADAHVRIHLSQSGTDNTFAAEVPGCFGGWVQLTFTYNVSGACTLYLNGVSTATGTAGSLTGALVFQNLGNVVFGCTQFMTTPSQTSGTTAQPWAAYFPGQIDQARVYSINLSDAEILALYNLEKAGR